MEKFIRLTDDQRELVKEMFEIAGACNGSKRGLEDMVFLEEVLLQGKLTSFLEKIPIALFRILFKGTPYEEVASKAQVSVLPYFDGAINEAIAIIKPLFIKMESHSLAHEKFMKKAIQEGFKQAFIIGDIPENGYTETIFRWGLSPTEVLKAAVAGNEREFLEKATLQPWYHVFRSGTQLTQKEAFELKHDMVDFLISLESLESRELFKGIMDRMMGKVKIVEPPKLDVMAKLIARKAPKEEYPLGTSADQVFEALIDVPPDKGKVVLGAFTEFSETWGFSFFDIYDEIPSEEFAPVLQYIRDLGFEGMEDRFCDISPEEWEKAQKLLSIVQEPYQDVDEEDMERDWQYNPTLGAIVLYNV